MKNDYIKNDNLKNEWSTYSICRKICFVIFVVLISSLILGSVGGLLYLFKPKKANADEYVGGTTDGDIISSAIVSVPVVFFSDGAYSEYDSPISNPIYLDLLFPIIFTTKNNTNLSISAYNSFIDDGYIEQPLPLNVGYGVSFYSYVSDQDLDYLFYLRCSFSNLLNSSFTDLYSVEVNVLSGEEEPVVFVLTDINGSILEYELTPYRYEEFGSFVSNPTTEFSGNYLYLVNSNVNFTERLNQAKEESFNNGYNQGYTEGKDYGYNLGYNQGVNDTDKFTFSSLLNAIFYAPLKAFIGIFNFEVLGVNVLNIISFLFTMLIAIGIIRWVV